MKKSLGYAFLVGSNCIVEIFDHGFDDQKWEYIYGLHYGPGAYIEISHHDFLVKVNEKSILVLA